VRVGSLFSGIGGLDLGLERAGMTIAWQVEIDEFCRKVLAKHWPDVPKYGDIRELTGHELESVDLIAAGFPCQPVSIAGRRLAQADERWLWPECARIIRVVRPRWVLLENVPGLLVRGMGDVLGDLAEMGFDAEWGCIPAAAFGAPHLRYRVFIVAYTHGAGLEGARVLSHPAWRSRYWTENQPPVRRVDDGVPAGVVRQQLTALGNAVVPQVAQWIGERILEVDARLRREEDKHCA